MTMNEISKNLGIGASTLHKWIKLFTETGEFGRGSGNFASDKDKEIARLKRQLRDAEGSDRSIEKINRDSEQVSYQKVYPRNGRSARFASMNGMCDYVFLNKKWLLSTRKHAPQKLFSEEVYSR
ncbi:transposase [Limosilactobacillus fermentum]